MVAIIWEPDRSPVAEVARKHSVSEQTIYNWRQHFGAMESADVKRLRLQVPLKRPRKRVAGHRPRPQPPMGPGQVWA